jgi:hypothetical protein
MHADCFGKGARITVVVALAQLPVYRLGWICTELPKLVDEQAVCVGHPSTTTVCLSLLPTCVLMGYFITVFEFSATILHILLLLAI